MILLDTTTRKLQVVLAGAVATNQLKVVVTYTDDTGTGFGPGHTQISTTNNTTDVDACAAPGASTTRAISDIFCRNADTAAATAIFKIDDAGTDTEPFRVTLAVGDILFYTHSQGVKVITSAGEIKTLATAVVSDGDKGDLTVSGGGTIYTIDPAAITYAKMQDVSATDKVLGRSTAGAGDVEEIACTAAGRALIDDADASAQRTTLGLGALAVLATVGTSQIDNDAVTYAKIQNISATDKVLGRSTAGAGDTEEIACTAAGRTLIAAASAAAETALLSAMVGDSGAGGTKGLAPAPGAGDAAAGKYLKADGVYTVPPAASAASDTVAGVIEIAVQSEMETGTSTTLAVTPGRQQYHPSACKGWVYFNGTGTVAILASCNVSSITDNGTGDYTVNWTVAFSSANYAWAWSGPEDNTGVYVLGEFTKAAGSLRVKMGRAAVGYVDAATVTVIAFGDQ